MPEHQPWKEEGRVWGRMGRKGGGMRREGGKQSEGKENDSVIIPALMHKIVTLKPTGHRQYEDAHQEARGPAVVSVGKANWVKEIAQQPPRLRT